MKQLKNKKIIFIALDCSISKAKLIIKSIPNYDDSYRLSEPFGSIKIIRDNHAIPHIFAEDNRDVFFGLGFAHAQDRLWQMILNRPYWLLIPYK